MSIDNKINKGGPFNLNRVINDFNTGQIDAFSAKPDLNASHQPHIDLNVSPPGQQQIKYRIYDTTGASNLLNDFGKGGFNMKR